jgi:hypothetical protein
MITNKGTSVTLNGTTNVATKMAKSGPLPMNLYLANPNPPREQKNNRAIVAQLAMMKVFNNTRKIFPSTMIVLYASRFMFFEIKIGGDAKISLSGFSDVLIIQTKGKIM